MKRKMWSIGCFVVLLTILGLPSIASAAGPAIFVNFGDIKGNAIDENHKDWVDALGISEALAGPPLDAQGRNVKATYSPFQITKVWDAASPKLREAALKGTHMPVCRSNTDRVLCPVNCMATLSGTPARTRLLTAVLRRS